jgi:hypothetical protein
VAAPTSYADPYWTQLASQAEARAGLPPGLLQAVVTHGERSNADQVSEAGAKTPFQITPQTRKLVLDRDGVDAYLNDQNAADAAAAVLKDGVKWASDKTQDPSAQARLAAGYYHAGGDTANWGPRTNAYVARVARGHEQIQTDTLANDVKAFKASAPDPLVEDIGAWKASQPTPGQAPSIPDQAVAPTTPDAPMSVGDAAVGAGEAGLSAITGMVGGYPAGVLSELSDYSKGISNFLAHKMGAGGPDVPIGDIDANASAASQQFTYQPRTAAGQRLAQSLGEFLNDNATPLAGLAPELSALHASAPPVIAAARDAVAAAPTAVSKAAGALKNAVTSLGMPEEAAATPGTMRSAGAAGTDLAAQRTATAESLPVPVKLTQGQATRDFAQQRFEQETAKDPSAGAPLRERYAQQNQDILRNFDAMVDMTGAEAPTLRATGEAVDTALKSQMQADKNAVRVAYKKAEAAGELEAPVTLDGLVQHLNESAPDAATAPLLDVARARALRLGIAAQDADGNLVAQPVPLKIAETYRQAINRATDFEPTNMRQAALIKQAVDQGTDGLGGELYGQARALRMRLAQNYENRATIAKLLDTKRGTADRAVALEDVFQHTILSSSADDVANVRRVLQRAGPSGWQAWRELQGATMRHIRDEATKGVSNDVRGNPIVSAARLQQVVRGLDHDGKLDFIFGKKGSQQVRDIVDLAKVVYTSPPGSVNTSNTASVLLAALTEAGVTGSLTGLPVPILTGLRVMAQQVKNRRIQQRVAEALGAKQARPRAAVH